MLDESRRVHKGPSPKRSNRLNAPDILLKPLLAAMRDISQRSTPSAGARGVLEACQSVLHSSGGSIYLLDLSKGDLKRFPWRIGQTIDVDSQNHPALSLHDPEVSEAISSGVPLVRQIEGNVSRDRRVLLPIFRKKTCIGVVELREPLKVSKERLDVCESLASLLVPIYEHEFALNLFQTIQIPINFDASWDSFVDDIMVLIVAASNMQYVALRELEDPSNLVCIGLEGFPESVSRNSFDLTDVHQVPIFGQVVSEATTVTVNSQSDPGLIALKSHLKMLDDVASFVATPLKVGNDVFGVLSFATSIEYDFAPIEITGFETIANAVGVSISNFRHFHESSVDLVHLAGVGVSITALEIAQAARHEAQNLLDECFMEMALMLPAARKVPELAGGLESLTDRLKGVGGVLEKIKVASRPPKRERRMVSIRELWDDACSQVRGRLVQLHIEATYTGPPVPVEVLPDWFRQVFLNLLLNSIDAFAEKRRVRQRSITLTVFRPHEKDEMVSMRYADNATGIDSSKLTIPEQVGNKSVEHIIFEPNVTSKAAGSGYGMFLVRKILRDHGGDIVLRDWRGGVVFDIRVPAARESGA